MSETRELTYLAVFDSTKDGYSIFFPDLPGCISLGDTLEEARENAKEALELHVYGMEKDKEELPLPSKEISKEDSDGCIVLPINIYKTFKP